MKISNKYLSRELKNRPQPLYWVCGDDPLLQQEACDLIRNHTKTLGFSERKFFQLETNFEWSNFLLELQSFSLFSEKLLIELRLGSKKLPDKGQKLILDYLTNPSEDKIILVSSDKLNAATQASKWFKAIELKSLVVQSWPPTSAELPAWISEKLNNYNLTASKEVVELLSFHGEGNLFALVQDIEKLSLLYPNKALDIEQVKEAISDNSRYDIFALIDAALALQTEKVLKILLRLKIEGTEPILILWALAREIRMLLSFLELKQEAITEALLRKNGVWPKRMNLIKSALKRCSIAQCQQMLSMCSQTDKIIKGTIQGNSWDNLQKISLLLAGVSL